ncbi:MAG TPA: hypothetical protein VLD57_10810 [Blastocatellia bacterium]|nr:hypothetical protein [Blastocatellia bacterium]
MNSKKLLTALLLVVVTAMALLISYATGQPQADEHARVLYDGTNVWVANAGSDTVMKLSGSTGATLGTFAVGKTPRGLAYDGSSVWVTNSQSNNVTRLRASDGAVLGSFGTSTQ